MARFDALINATAAKTGAAEFDRAADQVARSARGADAAVGGLDKAVVAAGAGLTSTAAIAKGTAASLATLTGSISGSGVGLTAVGASGRVAAGGLTATGAAAKAAAVDVANLTRVVTFNGIALVESAVATKAASAATVDLGRSSTAAATGVRSLAASITGVNASAAAFLPGLGAIVAGFATFATLRSGLSTFGDLESELTTLKGVSRATAEEFEQLSTTARDLGASTRFTATEAAEGLTFLARAGFSVREQLESVSAALDLASTSELTLGQSADVASNLLATFGIATKEASRVVDDLTNVANNSNTSVSQLAEALKFAGPIASATGKSLEETAAAIGVLGDRGIQASLAGTNIRGVLSGLLGPSESAREAIGELGLTLQQVDPATQSLTTIFEQFGRAGLTAAQSVEIFGRRNAGAALILAQTTDRIKELVAIQRENSGVTKELAEERLDTLSGRVDILKSTWEAFTESLVRNTGVLTLSKGIISGVTETLRAMQFAVEEIGQGVSFDTVSAIAAQINPEIALRVDLEETRRQVGAQQLELKSIFTNALAGVSTELDGRNNLAFAFDSLAPEARDRITALQLELEDLASSDTLDALDSDVQNIVQGIGRVADIVTLKINSSNEAAVSSLSTTIDRMEGLISGSSIGEGLKLRLREDIEFIRKDLGAFNAELARRRSDQERILKESNASLIQEQRLNAAGIFPGVQYDAPIGPAAPPDPTLSHLTRDLEREIEFVGLSADERERRTRVTEFANEAERVFGATTAETSEIVAEFAQRVGVLIRARNEAAAAARQQSEEEKAAAKAVAEAEREKARAILEAARAQDQARSSAARAAGSIDDLVQRQREEIAILSASASQRSAVAREIEIQRNATEGLAAALLIEDEAQRAAAISRIEAASATARAVGAQVDALRDAREAAQAYAGAVTRSLDQVIDKALEGTLTIRDLGAAARGLAVDIGRVAARRAIVEPAGELVADTLTGLFTGNAVGAAAGAVGASAARDVAITAQTVVVQGTVVTGGTGVAGGGGGTSLFGLGGLFGGGATNNNPATDPSTQTASTSSGFSSSGFGSIFGNLFAGLGKAFGFGSGAGAPPPTPPPAPPPAPASAPPAGGGGGFLDLLGGLFSASSGITAAAGANSANVGGATGFTGENLAAIGALGSGSLSGLGPTKQEVLASIGEPEDLGLIGGIQNGGGLGATSLVTGAEQLTGESFPNITFGLQRGIFDNFVPKNSAGNFPIVPAPGGIQEGISGLPGVSGFLGAASATSFLPSGIAGSGFSETDLVTLQNTSLASGAVGGISIQAQPEFINGRAPGFTGLGANGGFVGSNGLQSSTANLTGSQGTAQGFGFLSSIFGAGASTGSSGGGLFGGLFNFFEKGGLFVGGRHVPVTAHALGSAFGGGGLVDSPTFFASNEGLNVAGEAGSEIIAPAERDPRTGKLGVKVLGGGGGGTRIEVTNVFPGVNSREGVRKSQQHIDQEMRSALQGVTRG